MKNPCRVYWGSHGCRYERGHDGPHECECAFILADGEEHRLHHEQHGYVNVGGPPYYGPDTKFYGEDAG